MADRKISELPAADALVGTEVVPGAQAGTTKKITVSDIAALALQSGDDAADLGSGSATDGYVLTADGLGGAAWEAASAAGGDVTGPASSTDNALARFHETGGKTLQNSAATLSDNGALTLTGATVTTSQPILDVTQTWNDAAVTFTGIKANVTDTASAAASKLLDLQVGSASKFNVNKNGELTSSTTTGATLFTKAFGGSSIAIDTTGSGLGIYSANGAANIRLEASSVDVAASSTTKYLSINSTRLYGDAAHTLAQRAGTSAQTYRLYNTYTDASNYERLAFTWTTNLAEIKTEAAGTGTLRDLSIGSTGGKLAFLGATPVARQAHVADADTAHALNATFSDTEVESALNALATKINSILATLEAFGLHATS